MVSVCATFTERIFSYRFSAESPNKYTIYKYTSIILLLELKKIVIYTSLDI